MSRETRSSCYSSQAFLCTFLPAAGGSTRTLPASTTSYGETFTSPTFTVFGHRGTLSFTFGTTSDHGYPGFTGGILCTLGFSLLEPADIIWTPTPFVPKSCMTSRFSDASGLSRSSAICQSLSCNVYTFIQRVDGASGRLISFRRLRERTRNRICQVVSYSPRQLLSSASVTLLETKAKISRRRRIPQLKP